MAGSFNFGEWISARSVIGDALLEIGKTNEKLFVCTPDVGMNLKGFRQAFPERYIDVGIAEQNCVGVAAGLALAGNIPVIMGMLPFLSMRSCEQVRTAVCYQNLPVRIIGTGGGLTSGGGSTHNAMEDIAIVKSMVNMTVLSICDPNMIRDILHLSMEYPGPMYIRLAQGKKDRQLYEPGTIPFSIGGSVTAGTARTLPLSPTARWWARPWMRLKSWPRTASTCASSTCTPLSLSTKRPFGRQWRRPATWWSGRTI